MKKLSLASTFVMASSVDALYFCAAFLTTLQCGWGAPRLSTTKQKTMAMAGTRRRAVVFPLGGAWHLARRMHLACGMEWGK